MALTGRRKRNYVRTSRYGPRWRQIYYDSDGVCMLCQSPHNLEFHHEEDKLKLVCRTCHVTVIHENENAGNLSDQPKHHFSMLAQDISIEIEAIGLKNWIKLYNIKEKDGKTTKQVKSNKKQKTKDLSSTNRISTV